MSKLFQHFANAIAHATGRPATFAACVALVVLWALSGPFLGFSDTWQLVINTTTTVLTFLQVFLIQATQNRDTLAIHAKLDELLRAGPADNHYVGIEKLTEEELEMVRRACEEQARKEAGPSTGPAS
jgi:low affinity Fe/Cu permease